MNLKSNIAIAALALTAGSSAMAQLSYNVGAVSEYRYRGLSQTAEAPALQGGADYAHSSGFYIGAWASQIRWIKELGAANSVDTKGDVELDVYGGYKGAITKDLGYDVGYLRYEYVGNTLADISSFKNPNTDELYAALTYGPVTFKYSYALSTLFGTAKSEGSTYADLSATFDLGSGFSLVPHVGRQEITGDANKGYSYTDYSVTLSKDLGSGFSASIAAIATNADETLYTVNGRKLAKSTAVVGVKYTF